MPAAIAGPQSGRVFIITRLQEGARVVDFIRRQRSHSLSISGASH
jgi:hypothetical protein